MKKQLLFIVASAISVVALAAGPGGGGGGGFNPGGGGGQPGGNQPGSGSSASFTFDTFLASSSTNSSGVIIRENVVTGYAKPTAATVASGVTAFVDGAFAGCTSLVSIDLTSTSITEVPAGAFSGCTALTTVKLPSTCTTIGESAFAFCSSLATLTASGVTTVGREAFRYCTALASIPSSATTLGDYAFADSGVTSVSLTSGMTLGEGAFANCAALETVTLGSGVDALPDPLFAGCTQIARTDWSAVESFGTAALAGLDVATLTLSDSAIVGAYAFAADEATVALTLSNSSLPDMADYAFLGRSVSYTPVSGSTTAIEAAPLVEWLLEEMDDAASTVEQPADYNTATLRTWLGANGADYVWAAEFAENEDFLPLTVEGTKFIFNEPGASGLCVCVEPVACNTLSSNEDDWSFDNLVWSEDDGAYVAADATEGACFVRLRYTFDW